MTSVAEDEVMRILILLRNYLPARDQIVADDWNVPKVAVNSWDLIDKTVGTVGGGRIGYHMMKRLRVGLPVAAWFRVAGKTLRLRNPKPSSP